MPGRPIVEWRVVRSFKDWPGGYHSDDDTNPHMMIWDGDVAKLDWDYLDQNIPQGNGFYGAMRAFVGDLEIGTVTLDWSQHSIGWPKRLMINGYSIFDPKKRGGGYGRDFNDEPMPMDRTKWRRRADLDAAKAYVEKFFFEIVDKAGLVAK
jgi:hypothetical protein